MRKLMERVFADQRARDLVLIALILFFTLIVARPLFTGQIREMEDNHSALMRAVGLALVWQDGQVTGRWLPDINLGYGYPLLNFYAPLFSYLTAGLGLLINQYMLALNIVVIAGFFLSGLAMYFFAREHWGRAGGFLSAVAYLFVPFHLCDIYRRSANAEFMAFAFLPLLAWRFKRLVDERRAWTFLWAAVAVAGLVLCHNIMTVLFFPIMAFYGVFLCILSPQDWFKKIVWAIGAVALGMGLAAYFWLPSFSETQYVSMYRNFQGNWDYHHHFMTLKQLLFSPWTYGGISWGMGESFTLGWGYLLLTGCALLVFAFRWRCDRQKALHGYFWAAVGGSLAFLTLKSAIPLWDAFPLAKYIQYPWRLFVIISFIMSFLVGGVVLCWHGLRKWVVVAGGIGIILATSSAFVRIEKYQSFDLSDIRTFIFNARPSDNMEYLPKDVKTIPMVPPAQRYEVVQGQAEIMEARRVSGVRHEFTVRAATPALVCFHQFFFPGWQVMVDGVPVKIYSENPYGLIIFVVPPGEHEVRIIFGDTPVRVVAKGISFMALAVFLGMGCLLMARRASRRRV